MMTLALSFVLSAGGITYPPLQVQEEGAALPVEMRINFIGTSMTCADDAANGRTNCTVTAGGGASPLTTKGDIYTFSTVDARLGVGGDGNCLKADSTQATGLIWGSCGAAGSGLTYPEVAAAALAGF